MGLKVILMSGSRQMKTVIFHTPTLTKIESEHKHWTEEKLELFHDMDICFSSLQERIPIKWMGPEYMESTVGATEKSDVWSYAVVLWGISSLGATPHENIRSRELPSRIKKGEGLLQPEHCDDTWYGIMRKCWAQEPRKRPTFSEIRNQLDELFVASPGDYYYYYS